MKQLDIATNVVECRPPFVAGSPASEAKSMTGVKVSVLSTWEALKRANNCWKTLQHNPNADIDFFKLILRVREECENPYVICVERNGIPQTLLIGRAERSKVPIKFGYLSVARTEMRLITFIHGGLLGSLDEATADLVVKLIMDRMSAGDAQAVFFSHVRQNSSLITALKKKPRFLRRDVFSSIQLHRSMTIPDDVNVVYASLSTKVRKNHKWQSKKLCEAFGHRVEVRAYTRPEDLDTLFQDVNSVASTTYQRGLGVGFVDTVEMRERLQLVASNGWLQAFVLYLAGKPAAFWIGTKYKSRFFSDFMGYDATYAKHSPGMYLIFKSIESLCNQRGPDRVDEIDFGLGDAQYKQVLGTDHWLDESLYLYSFSLGGIMFNLSRTCTGALDRSARKILRRLGLENYVKAVWRKRVR